MIEVKTSELIGPALRYAVAVADGWDFSKEFDRMTFNGFCPDTDWAQGGPLLDKWCKSFGMVQDPGREWYRAFAYGEEPFQSLAGGPTILIAACRARVKAISGDTVQIPDELAERAGQ